MNIEIEQKQEIDKQYFALKHVHRNNTNNNNKHP